MSRCKIDASNSIISLYCEPYLTLTLFNKSIEFCPQIKEKKGEKKHNGYKSYKKNPMKSDSLGFVFCQKLFYI